MQKKDYQKLRECPFCGSKVEVTRGIANVPFLFFKCTNSDCGAVISFDNVAANLKPISAIDNYNRRADNDKV